VKKVDYRLEKMCSSTFWNTIKSTTKVLDDGGTFIFTGDIDDLWVRDSCAQVHPYIPLATNNKKLQRVINGLIKRLAFYILYDPYANAFRIDTSYVFSEAQKKMGRHGYISTWNYELDSGAYFFRLLNAYHNAVPEDDIVKDPEVVKAVELMVDLWITEQNHEADHKLKDYFNEAIGGSLFRYPGLPRNGKGSETAYTGMTWTGFRPSDDDCKYHYLVPANMFASATLKHVERLASNLWEHPQLAEKAKKLREEIDEGIKKWAIVPHPQFGKIYAFEVDGLGNSLLMDDANVPSLMSIPYLGWDYDPEIYENTRKFILSPSNPTFRVSTDGKFSGYGSPHMAQRIRDNIWPMAQIMQGLTTKNPEEKVSLLKQLTSSDAGTGHMHESYNVNNPSDFTRAWFCWADALFAEFLLSMTSDRCEGEMPLLDGV